MKKGQTLGLIIAIVVIGLLIYSLYPSSSEPVVSEETGVTYMDVNAAEAKELIDTNADLIVIDVSPHWAEGHLPRAISYYPSSALQEAISSGELNPNAEYLVYCHADGPSRSGAQALIDAGFGTVYRLESHFGGWSAAGYPIEQ
jgi:rhodanese-related sulfurtransferase